MAGHAAVALENRELRDSATEAPAQFESSINWLNEPGMLCKLCGVMIYAHSRRCACGDHTAPAALPMVVNGKFRVERLVGAGGMGVVYLATDLILDRKVAIKTLPTLTAKRAAKMEREARAMASVLHPNLACIYGVERWRGTPLLVGEYLEGGSLADRLARGPIEVAEALDIGIVIADVLDRVHGSGLLHRDVKPSNIGFAGDGQPKLLDFGLAAILQPFPADTANHQDDGATPPVMSYTAVGEQTSRIVALPNGDRILVRRCICHRKRSTVRCHIRVSTSGV
jgi:serine/threonine protein kinase